MNVNPGAASAQTQIRVYSEDMLYSKSRSCEGNDEPKYDYSLLMERTQIKLLSMSGPENQTYIP